MNKQTPKYCEPYTAFVEKKRPNVKDEAERLIEKFSKYNKSKSKQIALDVCDEIMEFCGRSAFFIEGERQLGVKSSAWWKRVKHFIQQ
jgi:hypothetical protein